MLRTAALYVLPAALIASAWVRLEDGGVGATGLGLLVLAALPAFARVWWARALAAAGVSLVAVETIYGVSIAEARPFDDERNFFGPVLAQFREGFLLFYDVPQPFAVAEYPLMHAIVLTATFGFALAAALAIGLRRPVIASLVLLVASVWPATLVSANDLARGAVTLAVVLSLLAFGGRHPTRALRPAAVAAVLLVAAAVGASTSEAVAKGAFVRWKDWDLYDKPAALVGVSYVWEASYGALEWPEQETTVLTVSGPQRNLYWRATTLDTFRRDRWVENLPVLAFAEGTAEISQFGDPLVPDRAYDESRWVRADVKVEALRDVHLVGPTMPVRYEGDVGVMHVSPGGVVTVPDGLGRGAEYAVWAFAPESKPQQLAEATSRPLDRATEETARRYLELAPGRTAPAFGSPGREERMLELFTGGRSAVLAPYFELYRRARDVVGEPANQYAAVVALEAWFRSEGGFRYDEAPPAPPADTPPLVAFALGHQRGYCQFYAGSMALMLRYLGIPARVAVGFTSGTPNEANTVWTVTDHDAHAWVEVWFPGWGWLPFDPTPGRGQLSSPYSFASGDRFDAAGAAGTFSDAGPGSFAERFNSLSEARVGEGRIPDVPGPNSYVPLVRERGESLLRLLVFVAGAAAAAIVLVKAVVRRRRFLTRDGRKLAAACRRDLADFLADQGIELPRSATPRELGVELHRSFAVDADAFVAALSAARYAPPRESRAAARRVRRELRAVRRRLRASLGVPRRLRGAVSLRSLAA